jgi:hypothetical protein
MAVIGVLIELACRVSAAQVPLLSLVVPAVPARNPSARARTMSFAEANENFRCGVHFGQLEPAWAFGPPLLHRRTTCGPP